MFEKKKKTGGERLGRRASLPLLFLFHLSFNLPSQFCVSSHLLNCSTPSSVDWTESLKWHAARPCLVPCFSPSSSPSPHLACDPLPRSGTAHSAFLSQFKRSCRLLHCDGVPPRRRKGKTTTKRTFLEPTLRRQQDSFRFLLLFFVWHSLSSTGACFTRNTGNAEKNVDRVSPFA